MKNCNVSFYGYNDGKAIEIYSCIKLFFPTVISIMVSLILSVVSYLLRNPYFLVTWIFPIIMLFAYVLCLCLTRYNDAVFLEGTKKKHKFIIENEVLIRDGKSIKKDGIKVYAFKKFIFLITKKSYYRVPNEEFIGITREEFLQFMNNK